MNDTVHTFLKSTSTTVVPSPQRSLVYDTERQRNTQFINKGISKPGRITFEVLRRAVQSTHIARICVNTLKEKVTKTKWVIKPIKQGAAVKKEQIAEIEELFKHPSKNDVTFRTLMDMVLEDLLVLDVACMEKTRTPDGKLAELFHVDASTIRPVFDEFGNQDIDIEMNTVEEGRVTAPVSYVQIANASSYGGPESGEIIAAWPKKDFIRFMQHPQGSWESIGYGLSGIESVINVVAAILNAQNFNDTYFEEGSFPPVIIQILGQVNQRDIQTYREYLQQELSGNYHRPAIMAGGTEAKVLNLKDLSNRDMEFMEYMKFMARLLAAAYGLSGQDIGLTDEVGSKNVSETQKEISGEKGYSSILHLIKEIFNQEIIWKDFGYTDIEFDWVADDTMDPKDAADLFTKELQAGLCTPNEARQKLGHDKYTEPWADQAMVLTTTGYVPVMAAPTEPTDTEKPAGQEEKEPPQKEEKEVGGERKYQDQKEKPDNEKKVPAEKSIEMEEPKKQMIDVRPKTSQVKRVEIVEDKKKSEPAENPEVKQNLLDLKSLKADMEDVKRKIAEKPQVADKTAAKDESSAMGKIITQLIGKLSHVQSRATKEKPDFDTTPVMFGDLVIDDGLKDETYEMFHNNDLNAVKSEGYETSAYNFNFENAKKALVDKIKSNPSMYGGIIRQKDINGARYIICFNKLK